MQFLLETKIRSSFLMSVSHQIKTNFEVCMQMFPFIYDLLKQSPECEKTRLKIYFSQTQPSENPVFRMQASFLQQQSWEFQNLTLLVGSQASLPLDPFFVPSPLRPPALLWLYTQDGGLSPRLPFLEYYLIVGSYLASANGDFEVGAVAEDLNLGTRKKPGHFSVHSFASCIYPGSTEACHGSGSHQVI